MTTGNGYRGSKQPTYTSQRNLPTPRFFGHNEAKRHQMARNSQELAVDWLAEPNISETYRHLLENLPTPRRREVGFPA